MMDNMITLRVTSCLKFLLWKFNFAIKLKIKRDLREFIHKLKTLRLLLTTLELWESSKNVVVKCTSQRRNGISLLTNSSNVSKTTKKVETSKPKTFLCTLSWLVCFVKVLLITPKQERPKSTKKTKPSLPLILSDPHMKRTKS